MSGADCNNGCTACPTCRGEVQPNAPAMHDMNFAMSMEWRAFADPMWGPLRVAQTVRDGIRERGETAVGDREILGFVDGLSDLGERPVAGVPWAVPLGRFQERPDPPGAPAPVPAPSAARELDWDNKRPRVASVKNKRIRGATLNPMRSRKRMLVAYPREITTPSVYPGPHVPGREGPPPRGKPRVPPVGPGADRKCCVEMFGFPEFMQSTTTEGRASFEFWVYAEYKEDAGCACACCYFEKYARRLDINETFRQDCIWTDAQGGRHSVVDETPPDDRPIDCDDMRHSGEAVGDVPHPVKHWSKLRVSSPLESSCLHRYYDEPWQEVGPVYDTTWEFIGIVYDVCHSWSVERTGWLQWRERKAAGGPRSGSGSSEDGDGNSTTVSTVKPPPRDIQPPSRKT